MDGPGVRLPRQAGLPMVEGFGAVGPAARRPRASGFGRGTSIGLMSGTFFCGLCWMLQMGW